MIYRMSRDIETGLRARKWPVTVAYGHDRPKHETAAPFRITIARDFAGGDLIGPPRGCQENPRKLATRMLGVVALIESSSGLAGARECDHDHACDGLVDAFLCELEAWSKAVRANPIEYVESRPLSPEERAGSECLAGSVHLLRFRVPRGVTRLDYDGAARPTGAAADVDAGGAGVLLRKPDGSWEEVDAPPPPVPDP